MGNAMNAVNKAETSDIVDIQFSYTIEELRQIVDAIPNRHPLLTDLKRKLAGACDEAQEEVGVNGQQSGIFVMLKYLSQKLGVHTTEHLFSKALSLVKMGVELEERGYEICAVRRSGLFGKEVVRLQIGRSE